MRKNLFSRMSSIATLMLLLMYLPLSGAWGSPESPQSGADRSFSGLAALSPTVFTGNYAYGDSQPVLSNFTSGAHASTLNSYCIPTYPTGSTNSYLGHVESEGAVTDLYYVPGSFPGYYQDLTSMSFQVTAGQTINFHTFFLSAPSGITFWVDWNNDSVFDNADEVLVRSTSGTVPSPQSFYFVTIPANAGPGEYRMRVRADRESLVTDPCAAIGHGSVFDFTLEVVDTGACNAPANLEVNNISQTGADLNWDAGNATQWEISLNGNPAGAVNSPSYSFSGLNAGTTYIVDIKAICGNDESYTVTQNFTTDEIIPTCVPFTGLSGFGLDHQSIVITWGGGAKADVYVTDLGGPAPDSNSTLAGVNVNSPFEVHGLEEHTDYHVYLRRNCGVDGVSTWFGPNTVRSDISPCGGKPKNIAAQNMTQTSADVTWNAGSASSWSVSLNGAHMANVNTPSYTFQGLNMGTNYTVSVKALCAGQESGPATVNFTTLPGNCPAPANMHISQLSFTSVFIDWDPSDPTDIYETEYGPAGFTQGTGTSVSQYSPTTVVITDLYQDTAYDVYVRKNCGVEGYSSYEMISFTTDVAPCFSVSQLFVNNITETTAELTWANNLFREWEVMLDNTILGTADIIPAYSLTGLTPGTTYTVAVRALGCLTGHSDWKYETFTTAINCDTATGLTFSNVTTDEATATWNAGNGSEWIVYLNGVQEATVTSPTYTFTGLNSNTSYNVEVKTKCNDVLSSAASGSFTTDQVILTCNPVTGLTITNVSDTEVWAEWDADASSQQYLVYINGVLNGVETDNTFYRGNLLAGTTYTLSVVNRCLWDEYADPVEITFTTTGTPLICPVPTNITTPGISETTAVIFWDSGSDAEYWDIYLDGVYKGFNFNKSYSFSGLTPNTTYMVEVVSRCGIQVSDPGTATFTTLGPTCDTPTNLNVNNITQTSGTAMWSTGNASQWEVSLNGTQVGIVNTPNYSFTGLTPGTAYTASVKAICGTLESNPATANFTTVAAPTYDCPAMEADFGDSCTLNGQQGTINSDCECELPAPPVNNDCGQGDDIYLDGVYGVSIDTNSHTKFADDFFVSPGNTLHIKQIELSVFNSYPSNAFDIYFYDDNNGKPGNLLSQHTQTGVNPDFVAAHPYGVNNDLTYYDVFLPVDIIFPEGHYWIQFNTTITDHDIFWVITYLGNLGNNIQNNVGGVWTAFQPTYYNTVFKLHCEPILPDYDCDILEANVGDACTLNGQQGTINSDCECELPAPTYDCPALEADFGDTCTLNGQQGTINSDCECELPTPPVNEDCGQGDDINMSSVLGLNINSNTSVNIADDFFVSPGSTLHIKQIELSVFTQSLIGAFDINFYDENNGSVGNLLTQYTQTGVNPDFIVTHHFGNNNNFTYYKVYLPVDIIFPEGHYWMQVNAVNSDVFWVITDLGTLGNPLQTNNGSGWEVFQTGQYNTVFKLHCEPVYECPTLEANVGGACTLNGQQGTINADCECELPAPTYDCPALEADFGDTCTLNGQQGTINSDCECELPAPTYDCPALEADFGDTCTLNGEQGTINSDCECELPAPTYDCPALEADFGDTCTLNGQQGTINSDCECELPAPTYDCPALEADFGDTCTLNGQQGTINADCECELPVTGDFCDWRIRVWGNDNGEGVTWFLKDGNGVIADSGTGVGVPFNHLSQVYNLVEPVTFNLNVIDPNDPTGYRSVTYNVFRNGQKIHAGTVRNKEITFTDYCSDQTNAKWGASASLTDFDFNYYPNPVKDVLHIESAKEVKEVMIYDLTGKQMKSFTKSLSLHNELDLTELPKGIYIFRALLEGGQVETFKVVKK